MNKKRFVVATMIVNGESLNYAETIGNTSELKKLLLETDGVCKPYSYISSQAIGYDIRRVGKELFGWCETPVNKDGKTTQFDVSELTSENYTEELMIGGYMITKKSSKKSKAKKSKKGEETEELKGNIESTLIRKRTLRISTGISMNAYYGDTEFQTNLGLSSRIPDNSDIVNKEIHKSLYQITFVLDLDAMSRDDNLGFVFPKEKSIRVAQQAMDIICNLYREIKGRTVSLRPLFIIGGVYKGANPIFSNNVILDTPKNNKVALSTEAIESVKDMGFGDYKYWDDTMIGMDFGIFGNRDEFVEKFEDKVITVPKFFNKVKEDIETAFSD